MIKLPVLFGFISLGKPKAAHTYTVDIPMTIIFIDTLFCLLHSRCWISIRYLSSSRGRWSFHLHVSWAVFNFHLRLLEAISTSSSAWFYKQCNKKGHKYKYFIHGLIKSSFSFDREIPCDRINSSCCYHSNTKRHTLAWRNWHSALMFWNINCLINAAGLNLFGW